MTLRNTMMIGLVTYLVAGIATAQVRLPAPGLSAGPQCYQPPTDIDVRRSLFVTDLDVVESAISLEDVLGALARDSGIPGLRAIDLWDQWWDTQNASPGLGLGPNCDEMVDANGNPAINQFPIQCERNEGSEINVDPFAPGLPSFYTPIALVNRFDLAPPNGANCGEYRIIFARTSGANNPFDRNLLIFEAVLPNPSPGCGIDGCQMVTKFWKNLSRIDDPSKRAQLLRQFYLKGFPSRNIPAVVRIDRFAPGAGQIRTNQFMSGPNSQIWQLREFKLAFSCASGSGRCNLEFVPITVKTNPFGELFDETFADARTVPFQRHFVMQVENLAENDINAFFATIPDLFNAGQSNSQGPENDYTLHFDPASHFGRVLAQRLRQIGSPLRPDHVVRRSQAMSCAGCHQLNNSAPANDLGNGLIWPSSLGFVHVSEAQTEIVNGVERFTISPALTDVFLPHREKIFEEYIDSLRCQPCVSLSLEADYSSDVGPMPISVAEDEIDVPVDLLSEKVKALDIERKQGLPRTNLGGPVRAH